MRYSILIPSYDPDGKNQDMFLDLIKSIEENSRGKDYELIIRKNGNSYTESHNDALLSARGDYVIVLNDDVLIKDQQWLDKLTDDKSIVSWKETDIGITGEKTWDFACWSMSRRVFETIGLFDYSFKDGINFEDNDYFYTARSRGIGYTIRSIDLVHYGGKVLSKYFDMENGKRFRNHKLFCEKWNVQI